MATDQASVFDLGDSWAGIGQALLADGAQNHRIAAMLSPPGRPLRDLADFVHHVCTLHGRHPGLIDHIPLAHEPVGVREWAGLTAAAFAGERAYLARLVAAVGPVPSTPGQAEAEAAVHAQRHALEILGRSDRRGCALGAAIALTLDWPAIRLILDQAAARTGIDVPPLDLVDRDEAATLVHSIATTPAVQRALAFGAQQLFGQHRCLWDLLVARAGARLHP